jgi:hypothetical protein
MPIYIGMDERDYRKADAVSNSDLKVVSRSPAHYIARRNEQLAGVEKDTAAKADGKALHCAVLEPEIFMSRYAVLPGDAPTRPNSRQVNARNPSLDTVKAIEWWKNWDAANPGVITLSLDKYDEYMSTADSIRKNPDIRPYLECEGDNETSIFATDPVTGVPVKIRADRRFILGGVRGTLDLKSTDDARPAAFDRIAWNFGYFQGAAFYQDVQEWAGEPSELFLIIAFEREAPYAAKLYELDPIDIDAGREAYRRALDLYAECRRNDEWPGYDVGIQVLSAPSWARGR